MDLVLPRILGALMVMLLLCIASSLGFLQIQGLVVIILIICYCCVTLNGSVA